MNLIKICMVFVKPRPFIGHLHVSFEPNDMDVILYQSLSKVRHECNSRRTVMFLLSKIVSTNCVRNLTLEVLILFNLGIAVF